MTKNLSKKLRFQSTVAVLDLIAHRLHFVEMQTALASHVSADITRLGKGVKNQLWYPTHAQIAFGS